MGIGSAPGVLDSARVNGFEQGVFVSEVVEAEDGVELVGKCHQTDPGVVRPDGEAADDVSYKGQYLGVEVHHVYTGRRIQHKIDVRWYSSAV